MSPFDIVALFAVMVALALVPSTNVALVVARSSTAGLLSGGAVVAGIVVGDLVFVLFAVVGMAALAEVMGGFFSVLRYLAGAYLIWFGVSLMRSKPSSQREECSPSVSKLTTSFVAGFFLTLGDVKAIFFYASLFPAFVDLEAVKAYDVTVIVVLTVVAVGGVKFGYAYCARRFTAFARGFKEERAIKFAGGGFMIGAGVYLMTKV